MRARLLAPLVIVALAVLVALPGSQSAPQPTTAAPLRPTTAPTPTPLPTQAPTPLTPELSYPCNYGWPGSWYAYCERSDPSILLETGAAGGTVYATICAAPSNVALYEHIELQLVWTARGVWEMARPVAEATPWAWSPTPQQPCQYLQIAGAATPVETPPAPQGAQARAWEPDVRRTTPLPTHTPVPSPTQTPSPTPVPIQRLWLPLVQA